MKNRKNQWAKRTPNERVEKWMERNSVVDCWLKKYWMFQFDNWKTKKKRIKKPDKNSKSYKSYKERTKVYKDKNKIIIYDMKKGYSKASILFLGYLFITCFKLRLFIALLCKPDMFLCVKCRIWS